MLEKGEILQGRYRIIRQLGHGGMGAVYEAKDERLRSSVALKEVIIDLDRIASISEQEKFRRAFEREATLLANLSHEAFPRVTDYFSEENRQFLIMELITGDDLGESLSKNKTSFPFETILKWTDQLLDALDYLHSQNPPIFHRDIKPQNLKVNNRGKIKLLDFGIAKSMDTTASTMTNQTFVGATLHYAPIEQILPAITATFREFIVLKHQEKTKIILSQSTDARCDIYALGATIYHLLTNRVPIDSAKRSLDIWEGQPDPLPNPSKLNSNIPPEFSVWLLKAMEVERENRYGSALEMQKALQAMLAGEKNKNKADEKTLVLPVKPTFSGQETENQLLILPEAETHKLIMGEKTVGECKDEFIVETQPALTDSSLSHAVETQSPEIVPPVTDSNLVNIANTGSLHFSKSDLTGKPYFNENLIEEKKTEPLTRPYVIEEVEKQSGIKPAWILPIAAVGILSLSGIVGVFLLTNSNLTGSNKTAANNSNSPRTLILIPNVTTTISPTPISTISPSTSPVNTTLPNNSNENNQQFPTGKPTQRPVKTTPTRTPTPKPTNCRETDDCIYNGRKCKCR